MTKVFALFFLLLSTAHAFVPTVESLFRHGANPDITANGLSLTLVIKKNQTGERPGASVNNASLLKDDKLEEYYKIFFTKAGDSLKIAQTRYDSRNFSEASLVHKIYYPNFSSYTMKPTIEEAEKGVFFALLHSMTLNNGSHMVNYLKSLGVPVRLNNEIINREKVKFLVDYKRYLVKISKDRNAKKTEVNPMRPDESAAQARADEIMNEPMYTDLKQVNLSKEEGSVAWFVNAGAFEAVISHKNREVQKIKYKSPGGDFEIICKDFWLANGTHTLPRFLLIKTFSGQNYQVEITNLRHYLEKEDDLIRRLKNWDQVLKGKESNEERPEFLL